MKKLFAGVLLAVLPSVLLAADQAVVDRYNKTCAICHGSGVANAPKFGDAAQWQPRQAKGMETLVASVRNGLGAMPPKGMCMDCSDADYQALIEYMIAGK
jgi:cytochrome c5